MVSQKELLSILLIQHSVNSNVIVWKLESELINYVQLIKFDHVADYQ